jgi:hypothetical protein
LKTPLKHNRVSLYLTDEMHARLLAAVESVSARSGLPFVSMANVGVLAIDQGLKRIEEENHNAAGRS